MHFVREYVWLPLQKKVFKDFGYYDHTSKSFKLNAVRVNEVLSGRNDPFSFVRENRGGRNVGTSTVPVPLDTWRGVLRFVEGEIKAGDWTSFLRQVRSKTLKVEEVTIVVEYVPRGTDASSTAEQGDDGGSPKRFFEVNEAPSCASMNASFGSDTGSSLHMPGSDTDNMFNSMMRSQERGTPAMQRARTSAVKLAPADTPSEEVGDDAEMSDGFQTVGDLVLFIKKKLEGASVHVRNLHIIIRIPPPGQVTSVDEGSHLRENTSLLHLTCSRGGLRGAVVRTSPAGEDYEGMLEMDDWRVYLHTVSGAECVRPLFPHWGCTLENLVLASSSTPDTKTSGAAGFPHHVRVAYKAEPETSLRGKGRRAVEMRTHLNVEARIADWSALCSPSQLSILMDFLYGMVGLPVSDEEGNRSCGSDVGGTLDGALSPVDASAKFFENTVETACQLSRARKYVYVTCGRLSLTLLTQRDNRPSAVASAWSSALTDRAAGMNHHCVYDMIDAPHISILATGVDVLFPLVDVHRAFPEEAAPVCEYGPAPSKIHDTSLHALKRGVYERLFTDELADSDMTRVLQKHGGRCLFIGVHSLHVLEYRGVFSGSSDVSGLPTCTRIFHAERVPYAFVHILRVSCPVLRDNLPSQELQGSMPPTCGDRSFPIFDLYEESLSVALATSQVRVDVDWFEVVGRYIAQWQALREEAMIGFSVDPLDHRTESKGSSCSTTPVDGATSFTDFTSPGWDGGFSFYKDAIHGATLCVHRRRKVCLRKLELDFRYSLLQDPNTDSDHHSESLVRLLRAMSERSMLFFATHPDVVGLTEDQEARFLSETLRFVLQGVHVSGGLDDGLRVKWSVATLMLHDPVEGRHTELVRAEHSEDMDICIMLLASPVQCTHVSLWNVLSVRVHLREVATQPIAQDDYLLMCYFVKRLLRAITRLRQLVEHLPTARDKKLGKPRPANRCGRPTSSLRTSSLDPTSFIEGLISLSDMTIDESRDDAWDGEDSASGNAIPKKPSTEERMAVWQCTEATVTFFDVNITRSTVQLLAPRLSPLGTPLGEPLLRCLPSATRDSVRREWLFHRYMLEMSGARVRGLLCGSTSRGAAFHATLRLAGADLWENIPPVPDRVQAGLLDFVSLVRSYTNWSAHTRHDGNSAFQKAGNDVCRIDIQSTTLLQATQYRHRHWSDIDIILQRLGIHHLPAHVGDMWVSVLTNFLSGSASPSHEMNEKRVADPASLASGSRGDASFVTNTRCNVNIFNVLWMYRPQGKGRSLLAGLLRHFQCCVAEPDPRSTPKLTVTGGFPQPISMYYCNDCEVEELTEHILGQTGLGWAEDMEAAGFVRFLDIECALGPSQNLATSEQTKSYPCALLASYERSLLTSPRLSLRFRNIYLAAFFAKDSFQGVADALNGLCTGEDLELLEPPHVLVMGCAPCFKAVGEEVKLMCAPMTHYLNPSLGVLDLRSKGDFARDENTTQSGYEAYVCSLLQREWSPYCAFTKSDAAKHATTKATGSGCMHTYVSDTCSFSPSTSSFDMLEELDIPAAVSWATSTTAHPSGNTTFDLRAECGREPHWLSSLHRPDTLLSSLPRPARPSGCEDSNDRSSFPPVQAELYLSQCGFDLSFYDGSDLSDAVHRRQQRGLNHIAHSSFPPPPPGSRSERSAWATMGRGSHDHVPLADLRRQGHRNGYGSRRGGQRMVARLRGVELLMDFFVPHHDEVRRVRLVVEEGTVFDCIDNSEVRCLLMATPMHPADLVRTVNFAEVIWLTRISRHASPVAGTTYGDPEEDVSLRIQPLSLTWCGASLDFMSHFLQRDGPAHNGVGTSGTLSSSSTSITAAPPLYFRRFTLFPTKLTLSGSFEGAGELHTAIANGNLVEALRHLPLLSFVSVEGLELPVPFVCVEDCRSTSLLLEKILVDSKCISLRFLVTACFCVIQPLSSVAKVGQTAKSLALVPLSAYRGAVFYHALNRAAQLLGQEMLSQSAHVAAIGTHGTYRLTRALLASFLGNIPCRLPRLSRGDQPEGLADAVHQGQSHIHQGMQDAFRLAAMSVSLNGGAATALAVPLRVLLGVSGAATLLLWGARNSVCSEVRERDVRVYKDPKWSGPDDDT